ncbi:MAG: hypothetical protein EBZ36_17050, partial [Acidobacteria bacterium]|nr:hypothetical protein [Acidobacteriota bacterium]
LASGGLDSLTCIAIAKNTGYEVFPISFDYGQKHRAELHAVREGAADRAGRRRCHPQAGQARAASRDRPGPGRRSRRRFDRHRDRAPVDGWGR